MKPSTKRLAIFIIPLVIFVAAIIMFFLQLGKPTDVNTSRLANHKLPAFSLPLLSDPERIMTNADLPKQPFILNVWGSWCITCHAEHPFLIQLHNKGVPMIGVNYKDERSEALDYLNKNSNPFIYSVQDYPGEYGLDLGLMGAPESYVVGADGVVYKHIVGEIGEQNWGEIEACMTAVSNDKLSDSDKTTVCRGVL